MGFFKHSNILSNNIPQTTKGFYIGTPEAEGENRRNGQNLMAFFEDYNEITQNIENGKFIISGRKGTGKSAYVKFISDSSSEKNELFSSLIRPSDFNLEACLQSIPDQFNNKYEIIFEWIILVRFVKLILDIKGGYGTNEIQALQRFQSKNSGLVEIDKYMTLENIQSGLFEVNFSPLKDVFKTTINKSFNSKTIKAPFYHFIQPLREIVCRILTFQYLEQFDFVVMFDDLDVKFKLSETNHKIKLLDLIRVAKRYNCEYLQHTKGKVLIFIRNDIAKRLGGIDSDKNKIFGSYEYNINWYNHNDARYAEKNILLRKFINKRIGINFKILNVNYDINDPWRTLVDNTSCDAYNGKSAFRYILDFTFYRPRDLINFFNNIGNESLPIPLSPDSIKYLLKKYVITNIEEIKDELATLFEPELIENIFDVLKKIANSYMPPSYQQVISFMQEHDVDVKYFETLVDYCLINAIDKNGNYYFKYRERIILNDYDEYNYGLPKALYIYFNPQKL